MVAPHDGTWTNDVMTTVGCHKHKSECACDNERYYYNLTCLFFYLRFNNHS